MHVLLVEDDPAIREGLSELISELAEVRAEGRVAGALKALEEQPFDLVITDLRIGSDGDGGKQVAQAARRYLTPVAIISAMSRDEVLARLEGVIPDDVLPKPFQLDEVLDMTERFLARRREADRYALQRDDVPATAFRPDPAGVELAPMQRTDRHEVLWFRAKAGALVEKITPAGTSISIVVDGKIDLAGAERGAGTGLYAWPGSPARWIAKTDVIGVSVVFKR